jgi:nucleotide-binding universal stress UspA family protein
MSSFVTPGSVLVGVDGSTGADLALAWAAGYADHRRRPLVVVHVTPPGNGAAAHDEAARVAAGYRTLDRALLRARASQPGVSVVALGQVGDPRAVLADLARDASALVVGSRGRGSLAGLLLGSVSVALAAQAPCPLVVVRPHPDAVAFNDLSVVVGLDGDREGDEQADALTLGFELASSQYRPLEVVHALGTPVAFPYPDSLGGELESRARRAAEVFLDEALTGYDAKFPDVVVHRRVLLGSPTRALVAASERASTVVVGRRGHGWVRSHLLGSVSRAVVEQAHSTVVVVRAGRR